MKFQKCLLFFAALMILTSCHNEEDLSYRDNGWHYLEGVRYTKDSGFCWIWEELVEEYDGYELINVYWYDREIPLKDGEYVEIFNVTDNGMTVRWGSENQPEYFNLGEATGNKFNDTFLCPLFHLECSEVVIPVSFEGQKVWYESPLAGHVNINDDFEIGLYGDRKLQKMRMMWYKRFHSHEQLITKGNNEGNGRWGTINYKFDSNTMKCIQSPIYIDWQTKTWSGEIASSMEDPADFLQLIMAIPIFKTSDYGFEETSDLSTTTREKLSFERLSRILYAGISVEDSVPRFVGSSTAKKTFQYPSDMVTMVDIGNNTMKMFVDLRPLFDKDSYPVSNAARVDCYCNIARSLLSESKAHFFANYQLKESGDASSTRVLEFRLRDEEDSRQLLKNLIIPYMIAHREEIKAYIQNHPTLSKHSAALCSAMDRLEELVEGTTKITIGYNLIEVPVGGDKTFEHVCREIWESDPEIE